MPFQPPTDLPRPAPVNRPKPEPAPGIARPATGPKVRRDASPLWGVALAVWFALSLAFAGTPARADAPSDVVRYLERISDSLRELAHAQREVRVTCECKQ